MTKMCLAKWFQMIPIFKCGIRYKKRLATISASLFYNAMALSSNRKEERQSIDNRQVLPTTPRLGRIAQSDEILISKW